MTVRAIGALVALLAVLAGPAGATPSAGPRTIGTRGLLSSISADGGRVAIRAVLPVGDGGKTCQYGSVWTPAANAVVRFPSPKCSEDPDDYFVDLTLGGQRAAWTNFSYGNHAYCDELLTATLAGPKPVNTGFCDGTSGDEYFNFRSDGSLIAFSDYTVCDADCIDDNGETLPDGPYQVAVYRLVGARAVKILAEQDLRTFLDAKENRILVAEPKGELVVYNLSGKKVWGQAGVNAEVGFLDGNQVVVQEVSKLVQYARIGKSVERSLPKGAKLRDVDHGLAVYSAAGALHTLNLANGRDRVVSKVTGLVSADLEPAGLFYGYNVARTGKAGRVTFVPRSLL
jgi:hypothetical protein